VPRAAGVERGRDAGETGEADRYLGEYEERVSALHGVSSAAFYVGRSVNPLD
jgi:hypothetical protein